MSENEVYKDACFQFLMKINEKIHSGLPYGIIYQIKCFNEILLQSGMGCPF